MFEFLSRIWRFRRPNVNIARTYEKLGRWKEAATEYDTLLSESGKKYWVDDFALHEFELAKIYDKLNDTDRARHWYERFAEDWKDADPDIPELIEARERLGELKGEEVAAQ